MGKPIPGLADGVLVPVPKAKRPERAGRFKLVYS